MIPMILVIVCRQPALKKRMCFLAKISWPMEIDKWMMVPNHSF